MSLPSVGPSYYADFNGLDGLKKGARACDPEAIRQVARQFESLFTNMLLKSMREAKLGDAIGDSQQTDFYQGMFDQQLAMQMSQGKGIGLADMLVRQLTHASAQKAAVAADSATGASDAERRSFIQSIEPAASRAAANLGVSSDAVIAQAALETGWGRHVPGEAGNPSSNLFGIKATTDWRGEAVSAATTEFGDAGAARVQQAFRSYGSSEQSVADYAALLQSSPRYQRALNTGSDVGAFGRALQDGGYATDPDYVRKLAATAASVHALRAADATASLKVEAALPTTAVGEIS
jgi:flagellar protein FlgJ